MALAYNQTFQKFAHSFVRLIDVSLKYPHRAHKDRDKVVYVSFYLADGAPSSWYRTIELDASRSHLLDNHTSFIDAFKVRFQDSDQYASALRKMRKLKQTSSCAIFTNQYIEILAELDWTEQTKIQEYYDRLKDAVKFTLCNRKGRYFSQNFEEYSKVCIDIDNELHSLSLETASPRFVNVVPPSSPRTSEYLTTDNPFAHRPAAPAPSVLSNTSDYLVNTDIEAPLDPHNLDVVPMQIDSIRRGPLTTQEKERRRNERLCLYCGQADHFVTSCPNKPLL